MQTFIVSASLGQVQDTTALCILEQTKRDTGEKAYGHPPPYIDGQWLWPYTPDPVYENLYAVRHLERLEGARPIPSR